MSLTLTHAQYAYPIGAGAQPALHDVSIDVSPGEFVLVVGTTGSGKSTLLRAAAGLLALDAGRAAIDGEPLTPSSARGRIGLVFQNAEAQLFADTLLDDVAFGPRNLGASDAQARDAARAALERVGLDPDRFGERSPFSLSGGEARRAAFAGVLAMEPVYLLADEPTAGLDADGRAAVRAVLGRARERAGVVVVSHTSEEFLGHADRVLVMDAGRTSWYGPAAALVDDPAPFMAAGLRPPAVLEVQALARRAGAPLESFTLDPVEAARALASAGGW